MAEETRQDRLLTGVTAIRWQVVAAAARIVMAVTTPSAVIPRQKYLYLRHRQYAERTSDTSYPQSADAAHHATYARLVPALILPGFHYNKRQTP